LAVGLLPDALVKPDGSVLDGGAAGGAEPLREIKTDGCERSQLRWLWDFELEHCSARPLSKPGPLTLLQEAAWREPKPVADLGFKFFSGLLGSGSGI
jgi:hypothetical protein